MITLSCCFFRWEFQIDKYLKEKFEWTFSRLTRNVQNEFQCVQYVWYLHNDFELNQRHDRFLDHQLLWKQVKRFVIFDWYHSTNFVVVKKFRNFKHSVRPSSMGNGSSWGFFDFIHCQTSAVSPRIFCDKCSTRFSCSFKCFFTRSQIAVKRSLKKDEKWRIETSTKMFLLVFFWNEFLSNLIYRDPRLFLRISNVFFVLISKKTNRFFNNHFEHLFVIVFFWTTW